MHRKDPSTNPCHFVTFLKDNNIQISSSTMNPSEALSTEYPWLFADNNTIDEITTDTSNAGKWIILVDSIQIDDTWTKVKKEIEKGNLWRAKVTTLNSKYNDHLIIVYVADSADLNAIKITYQALLSAHIAQRDQIIKFKMDKQTLNHQNGEYAYLYTSSDIQTLNDDQLQFIYSLTDYRIIRDKEQTLSQRMFNTFFGMITGMSATVKLSAVDKILKLLRGLQKKEDEPLTWDELSALRDGRLGRHIGQYEKLDCLPKEFTRAEQDKAKTMSRYMLMQ